MHSPPDFTQALAARYTLRGELGRGGMAVVYRAHDRQHDREVALKVLDVELASSVGRERFQREIRLAARLTHPHILPLFDSGEAAGVLYYTMPVMAGETLRARLNGGPLPVAEAVRIATAVADALDYAHRHDVVHRDIKPENILLHEGHAVVADFGVGKAVAAATSAGTTGALTLGVTQAGLAVGTPAYMSPEQALGDAVDGRSDLFALGCVLYEMLTGAPPFAGATAQATLVNRLTQVAPPVTAQRPAVPEAVSRTVDRLLEKAPEARLATGAEVTRALAGELALAPRREVPSVAVLPFANMSADPDNAYFADGITDDIIIALTRLPGLKVAARASAFTFRGAEVNLQTVGEALGVRHVVQGSVRRAGSRVRVTAQLMSVADGSQPWSGRWDRELDDIFAIQDEIAQGIVAELEVQLGAREAAAPLVPRATADLAAYDLFLRGRDRIRLRKPSSIREGLVAFQDALALDPSYGDAWLGIAEGHAALGVFGYASRIACRRLASDALAQAERLAASRREIDRIRLMVMVYLASDWRDAAPLADHVLRREPHDPVANAIASIYFGLMENRAALAVVAERAMAADPLSPWVHSLLSYAWAYAGDFQQALDIAHRSLGLSGMSVSIFMLPVMLSELGRHDEAAVAAQRAVEWGERSPITVAMLAHVLWRGGRLAEAQRAAEEVRRMAPDHEFASLIAEAGFAGEERLAHLLRRALDLEAASTSLRISPRLRDLLDHPRLGALVRALPTFAHLSPG